MPVGVRRVDDRAARAEAAAGVEQLDRPQPVLGQALRDLLMEMRDRGSGIYIMPVTEGMEAYGVDGWVVGRYDGDGPQDLAVGPWLDQVVEAARDAAG